MSLRALVVLLSCISASFGQTKSSFFVATTGDDSNPGTLAAPWRTIQHAADTARAGSIVYVRGGIYQELVNFNASGNASDGFITFRSYRDETAVLDATHFSPTGRQGIVTIHNQSYVRIEGLEIRNFRTAEHRLSPLGIDVRGSGSHIELLKNNVHHIENTFPGRDHPGSGGNGFGIAVYGTDAKTPITDLIIEGNEVHHLKTGSSESLVVNGNVTNFRITGNIVHDNNNIGIDVIGFERTAPDPAVDQARDGIVSGNLVYNITSRGNPAYRDDESSDGIYVDGGTRILIEQNVIHDVDFGLELASEHKDRATSYITARNNLIYHCHTAGVSIGGYAPERGHTEHSTVVNNTLYQNDTSATGSGEFQMQWNMADNVFENNIVHAGPRCRITLNRSQVDKNLPPAVMDHNLYYCTSGAKASNWASASATVTGFDNYVEATGNDLHSRFLDPHFVDTAASDFHLQSDSPAIAAGTLDGIPAGELDLEGSPRTKAGKIDIGCYERRYESSTLKLDLNRREFLKISASAGAALAVPTASRSAVSPGTVGIQVGAVSFVDEGTEKVLDVLHERASVNTLFLAVFTYGRGIAGRQIPGQPLPDHGKQEYDLNFHGGNFATPHPQYYQSTVLKETRAPDHGDLDILAEVLPEAKKRGMKVICWLEDVFRTDLPNIEKLQEQDLYGRNAETLCVNNPDYRNFLTGLVEDYARSYDIDGIMWGSERQGALCDSLGATHDTPPVDPGNVTCFCQFCRSKAKERGINVDRARQGFLELEKFVRSSRRGKRPVDGYYVQFWRLLLRYPELAAWEMLWTDSLRETYAAIYKTVKTAKPAVPVGWHIWHNNSFNPIYRAEQDLHELSNYSDFIKVVMYNNCGGERMAFYAKNSGSTLYADLSKRGLLDFNYAVLGLKEGSYDQIPQLGLSPDYVFRETKRALEGVAGTKTLIWPGIDIDIPTEPGNSKCTPQSVKQAVLAALRAGATGLILSRKYSEMRLANLSGAGDAIREMKA